MSISKGSAFADLHKQGCFIAPNPWDAGSAILLQGMGFKALASTSSGFALTLGRRDGQVSRDEKLAHCRLLCDATLVPITADLENGYGDLPEEVAKTIALSAQTGLAGGSIEDYTGDRAAPLYPLSLAVERIQAAVEQIGKLDTPYILTARAEQMLRSDRDLDKTIERLQAFEQAGAHVLYAPGLKTLNEVKQVVSAVSRPVNVLMSGLQPADVPSLAGMGVRRLSTGGSLALRSVQAMIGAGEQMLADQNFDWLGQTASHAQLKTLMKPPGEQ
ncbi:MAG: oxaloacetate decarboxylase [Burkholderiaceae bacterium]